MDKFISTGFCLTQFLTSSTNGIIYEELTILISLQVTNTLQAVWRCVVCVDTCDIPLLQQIATCWATEAKSHTLNCSIPNYTVNPGLSYTYVYLELHICSDPIIYALFCRLVHPISHAIHSNALLFLVWLVIFSLLSCHSHINHDRLDTPWPSSRTRRCSLQVGTPMLLSSIDLHHELAKPSS